MPLDLEEQEKVAELRAWWNQNGTLIMAVITAVALAVAGWSAWQWHARSQAAEASALYETLSRAAQEGDAKALRDAGGTLVESYPRTLYASMGALLSARYYFDRGDLKNAKAQLQWVVEHARSDDFRDIARLRLGAVLLDEKAYDDALKQADAPHGAAFDAQFAALKGDILAAKSQPEEAKAAYRVALEKAGSSERAFRDSVRIRLEGLGG
ncbi:MAG TPA: tetratricopeptide repeat protein [Burkholderiales bacterium]|nr:tetratricopeptide repeat protein [Burkholderiales bacterium]